MCVSGMPGILAGKESGVGYLASWLLLLLIGVCAAAISSTQVPFHWSVPLMATEVATHAYGSYVFDLQPRYWLAVRYLTGLAIAMAVAAAHNALARKQFCSHGSRGETKVA